MDKKINEEKIIRIDADNSHVETEDGTLWPTDWYFLHYKVLEDILAQIKDKYGIKDFEECHTWKGRHIFIEFKPEDESKIDVKGFKSFIESCLSKFNDYGAEFKVTFVPKPKGKYGPKNMYLDIHFKNGDSFDKDKFVNELSADLKKEEVQDKKIDEATSWGDIAEYQDAWKKFKAEKGNEVADALEFIDAWCKKHPDMDNEDDRNGMFADISAMEESLKESADSKQDIMNIAKSKGYNVHSITNGCVLNYSDGSVGYKSLEGKNLKDLKNLVNDLPDISESLKEDLEFDAMEDFKSEIYNAISKIYAKYELKGATLKDLDSAVDFATIYIRDEFSDSLKEDAKEPKLETFEEKIDFLVKDEDEAIAGYDKIIAMLGEDDANAIEQLTHIKEEEIAHKDFLEVLKKDPSAIYEHEDEEEQNESLNEDKEEETEVEEPKEEEPVEEHPIETTVEEVKEIASEVANKVVEPVSNEEEAEEQQEAIEDAVDEVVDDKFGEDDEEDDDEMIVRDNDELIDVDDDFDDDFGFGEGLKEDTVKKDNKWVNKGKEGTHGEFKTKKEADAQRKAMFANGYHEEVEEDFDDDFGDRDDKFVPGEAEHFGITVDWDDLEDDVDEEDAKTFKKVIKSTDDKILDKHFGKGTPERKLVGAIKNDIDEEAHETGHIKAKKPIELRARR